MADAKRTTGSDRLTDTAIRAWLRKPGANALHDGGGLYLRRRAGGAFWSLRQVNPITGARTWSGLFPDVPYPTASLADARRKADSARLEAAARPTDVVRDRIAALATTRAEAAAVELAEQRKVSVRQLFDDWAAVDLAPRIRADGTREGRKDGGQYTREQFERRVFPSLGTTAVPMLTKADLMRVVYAAKSEGKLRTANVLLTDLKQMLRFAVTSGTIDRNPLEHVTKSDAGGKERSRARVLSAGEIGALSDAVPNANMSDRSAAAIWLILSTGCRVGEAMGARWEHVDVYAATWHLPTTKNERAHTIHLSPFALRHVQALLALRGRDERGQPVPWVFPNSTNDGAVCVKSFGKQLSDRQREPGRRMTGRSKQTTSLTLAGGRWTAHDLRRTAATMMAELGISGDVIDECLNHVIESRVRRTYVRDRRMADQARAFDLLGARLSAIIDGTVNANVTPMARAA